MSRRTYVLVGITILLLGGCGLAACGGSSSASRSSTASSTGSSTVAPPPAVSRAPTTASVPAGSSGARLPATFTIRGGDRLDPPTVSSPASLAIQLTVVSADGRSHSAVLRTPTPHVLAIPAGGRSSILIGGLRAGRYVLEVDGVARGGLDVGGQPGP